jgi:hypothetical protein
MFKKCIIFALLITLALSQTDFTQFDEYDLEILNEIKESRNVMENMDYNCTEIDCEENEDYEGKNNFIFISNHLIEFLSKYFYLEF